MGTPTLTRNILIEILESALKADCTIRDDHESTVITAPDATRMVIKEDAFGQYITECTIPAFQWVWEL